MLVLTRKIEEVIEIGDGIKVKVVNIKGGQVRLAIEAPAEVSIRRGELAEKKAMSRREKLPAR